MLGQLASSMGSEGADPSGPRVTDVVPRRTTIREEPAWPRVRCRW
jgi:hypothetical protein